MQCLEGFEIAVEADPQDARGFARTEAAGLPELQNTCPTGCRGFLADTAQEVQTRVGLLAEEGQRDVHERGIGPAIVASRVVRVELAEGGLYFFRELHGEEQSQDGDALQVVGTGWRSHCSMFHVSPTNAGVGRQLVSLVLVAVVIGRRSRGRTGRSLCQMPFASCRAVVRKLGSRIRC